MFIRHIGPGRHLESDKDLCRGAKQHISPGFKGLRFYAGIALARGRNEIVTDEDGKQYIDFVSGIGVGSVGHCHPRYVEALKKQLEELTFGSFTTEGAHMKFSRLLASLLPPPLTRASNFFRAVPKLSRPLSDWQNR